MSSSIAENNNVFRKGLNKSLVRAHSLASLENLRAALDISVVATGGVNGGGEATSGFCG